jgi:hypothetical protein
MPAKPSWLLHIAEIRSMLTEVTLPVIDRAVIQSVFGLGRRQAIALLHHFGGYQAGNTFLVERARLIAELDKIAGSGDYQQEQARRERLAAALGKFQRARRAEGVRIEVSPEAFSTRMSTLSKAVRLVPGKLEVAFSGSEDLLTKLFTLAQAAANDYDGFQRASGG